MQTQQQLVYVEQEEEELEEQLKKYIERLRKLGLKPLIKKGLIVTLAYHCNRCNYSWFPKDFDATFQKRTITNKKLMNRAPPKACARCKSKYWNSEPKNKTPHTKKETLSEGQHKHRSEEPDKMGLFGHDMLTSKRLRAEEREIKRRLASIEKREKFLEDFCKEHDIDIPT